MVLSCRNLHRAFGSRIAVDGLSFDGLSFDVAAGEAYGLLGPNGAGKTTTIPLVCGILSCDRGQVTGGGMPIAGRDGARARSELGYVPQTLALFPSLTLVDNLRFWSKLYGVPRRLRRERIEAALLIAGLWP